MKKFISGLIFGIIIASLVTTFAADTIKSAVFNDIIKLKVDRKLVDTELITVVLQGETNGKNYVSVRALAEAMGGTVTWNGSTNTIEVTKNAATKDSLISPILKTNIVLSDSYYKSNDGLFELLLPSNWKTTEVNNNGFVNLTVKSDIDNSLITVGSSNNQFKYSLTQAEKLLLNPLASSLLADATNISSEIRTETKLSGYDAIVIEKSAKLYNIDRHFYFVLITEYNRIYMITLATEKELWRTEQDILKQSINSFTPLRTVENNNIKSTDKDLSTASDLKAYLEANFSELDTCIGKTEFTFNILENATTLSPEDYWIQVRYEYAFFEGAMISNKYTDREKRSLKDQLKDHQEKLAKAVMKLMPGKKIYGGYYDSWYRYPNLKVDLQTRRYFSWTNYKVPDFLTENKYAAAKPSSFRWYPDIDDELE